MMLAVSYPASNDSCPYPPSHFVWSPFFYLFLVFYFHLSILSNQHRVKNLIRGCSRESKETFKRVTCSHIKHHFLSKYHEEMLPWFIFSRYNCACNSCSACTRVIVWFFEVIWSLWYSCLIIWQMKEISNCEFLMFQELELLNWGLFGLELGTAGII